MSAFTDLIVAAKESRASLDHDQPLAFNSSLINSTGGNTSTGFIRPSQMSREPVILPLS